MNKLSTSIIPAAPGWRVLWMNEGTGRLEDQEPILAWALVHSNDGNIVDLGVHPIVTQGACEDPSYFLQHPDGRVEKSGMRWGKLELANEPEECEQRLQVHEHCG